MIRTDEHQSVLSPRRAIAAEPEVLAAIAGAIGRLSYGLVQLTVHDGKVVQLDVTERQRFPR